MVLLFPHTRGAFMYLNESRPNLIGLAFALDPTKDLTVKTLKDSITGLTILLGLLKSVGQAVNHGSCLLYFSENGLHVC